MEIIPIKTQVLKPPKDDLFRVLDTLTCTLHEGDVVVVTSKVVSIHEGRCVSMLGSNKEALIEDEADFLYYPTWRAKPLTITNHALISAAGIDESNGGGYYILLPQDSFHSARAIRRYCMDRFKIAKLGVVITDSHSLPFRYGAMSVAIGCWGFVPVESHVGQFDLFGRTMSYSKTNIPDAIAGAATLVSGECDEAQPIAIVRGLHTLVFSEEDPRPSFFVPYEEDIYRDLFREFKKPNE